MKHIIYFILRRIRAKKKMKKLIMKIFNSVQCRGIQFPLIKVPVERIRTNCKISTKNTTQTKQIYMNDTAQKPN